jgi:hypothetical protein
VQPVPLALVIRRVGREHERTILGGEARSIARALYTMFGVHVRADHMARCGTSSSTSLPGETVMLRRRSLIHRWTTDGHRWTQNPRLTPPP